jgi:hypothetical protein
MPPRPKFGVRFSVSGYDTEVDDQGAVASRRQYATVAEFIVHPGETREAELSVPAVFTAMRVATQVDELDTPVAEHQFGRLVVSQIPADVWDAGIAALVTGDEQGRAMALAIVERWWKRDEDQALDALGTLGDRLGDAREALRFVRRLLPTPTLPEGHPNDTDQHHAARLIDAVLKEK